VVYRPHGRCSGDIVHTQSAADTINRVTGSPSAAASSVFMTLATPQAGDIETLSSAISSVRLTEVDTPESERSIQNLEAEVVRFGGNAAESINHSEKANLVRLSNSNGTPKVRFNFSFFEQFDPPAGDVDTSSSAILSTLPPVRLAEVETPE